MKTKSKKELIEENKKLRKICSDLQWMAKRYADGRMSYAVSLLNDHTYTLLKMNVNLNMCAEQKLFARDGMKGFELSQEYIDLEKEYVSIIKKGDYNEEDYRLYCFNTTF